VPVAGTERTSKVTGDTEDVLGRFERELRRPRFDEPRRERDPDGTINVAAGERRRRSVDLSLGDAARRRRLVIEACDQT
jgi:hypothetical protein